MDPDRDPNPDNQTTLIDFSLARDRNLLKNITTKNRQTDLTNNKQRSKQTNKHVTKTLDRNPDQNLINWPETQSF